MVSRTPETAPRMESRWGRLRRKLLGLFGRTDALTLQNATQALEIGRYAEAVQQLKALHGAGDVHAAWHLGQCYEHGTGVLQNAPAAVRAYQAAASGGVLAAQVRLGEIFLTGLHSSGVASGGAVARLAQPTDASLLSQLFVDGVHVAADPVQAAHWNQQAVAAGDVGAKVRLGHQYAAGEGVEQSLPEAERWFKAAADVSDPMGSYALGLLYAGQYGVFGAIEQAVPWLSQAVNQNLAAARLPLALVLLEAPAATRDWSQILRLLAAAARAGEPHAMYRLGEVYRSGAGGRADFVRAETWLRRAAAKGVTKANVSLARLLLELPEVDRYSAATVCRAAADAGDAEAQYLMGVFALEGIGLQANAREALGWFQLAADQYVVAAFERLGFMHAEGLGVPVNLERAREYWLRAAEADDPDALLHLSVLDLRGIGGEPADGIAKYQQLVARGHAPAALHLGFAYATGAHVPQDLARAVSLYEWAAERGIADAAFALGCLYRDGIHAPPDVELAREWLVRAADAGSASAMQALGELLEQDTPLQDVAAAQAWRERALGLKSAGSSS